jgi:tetratricopeptide (TPR) repeat protein
MSPRPAIFVSAVSSELRSARQLVANTLTFLGYDPEWQDIFGTEEGDLRAMLRRRIDSCKGVVQLLGKCYGAEPPTIDRQFGRVSYTQYEALYALSKGKKVWYLFLDQGFPTDPHEAEDEEKLKLQSGYRDRVKAESHLYHPLNSREGLEASVLKLRDDLTQLRRGVRRWAAFVAVLLVLSVGLSVWVLKGQRQANEEQRQTNQQLLAKVDKILLLQGVNAYADVQNKVRQEQPKQKPEEIEERTYEELGKQLGIDPKTLKEELPRFAEELKKSPNATTYERANAAYVAKDYLEAERLALAAADEAQLASAAKNAEAIKAFELAAWAAEKRAKYADSLRRLRDAEQLTDRTRDAVEWARVQFAIAWVLEEQGQYRDTERIVREVLKERERALGPEDPDTLASRNTLAIALDQQGNYPEAEKEYRIVMKLREKVLGPEHPDTLMTRFCLATALDHQGKYPEAEKECRDVMKLRGKILGPEHPDTLMTRFWLAVVLDDQGKYIDAEAEFRAVVRLQEKVLGSEHPNTLHTRYWLANALDQEGKYPEAEAEGRAVVKLEQKVLGSEHPYTLEAYNCLASILDDQGKYAEAETEYRAVITLEERVLGPEHPLTLATCNNLAETLNHEGKYAEAETEYRVVLNLQEKVLGHEHSYTLQTRGGLAKALGEQGKYAEAEIEYRAVLKLQEKVLGPEHPDTLRTCFDLAICLRAESQIQEASAFAQRAAAGATKILGPKHPDTQKYEQLRQELLAKNG